MANNYLITGYWGEPHVTAENDRGIHAGIVGAGRFVLPVGEQFRAEYIGNNTIRVYDGKLMDNGAAAGIPAGEYIDLLIANAGQEMKRNDLIVFQYVKDASTLIETGTFIVVQGTEGSSATDPELEQEDLLTGSAFKDQFPLWRIPVDGATISAPVQMFEVSQEIANLKPPAVNYCTEEAATGDTWVDGKPIYRKIVSLEISKSKTWYASTGDNTIPNVDTVVHINTMHFVTSGAILNGAHYYDADRYIRLTYLNKDGVFKVEGYSTGDLYLGTTRAIVYYTKTTD